MGFSKNDFEKVDLRIKKITEQTLSLIHILPEEAEIVKLIFRLYLEGYSTGKIAKHLEEQGIKTATGQDKWHRCV